MEISEHLLALITHDIRALEKILMRPLKDEEQQLYIEAWLRAYEENLDGKAGNSGEGGMPPTVTDWQWCIADWARSAAHWHLPTREEQERHDRKKRLAKQAEAARARLRSRNKGSWHFKLKPGSGPQSPKR